MERQLSEGSSRAASKASKARSVASLAQNRAFVFVKPHALTEAVVNLVREQLTVKAKIVQEGQIDAATIDRDMLVDKHYYAIASKATLLKPDKLPVPADKFKDKFGLDWAEVLKSGHALNAREACDRFGVDASGLFTLWSKAKDEGLLVKFSGGFYCAQMEVPNLGTFYVFNGFFMEMRNKYVAPGAAIHYFLVDWSPMDLAWSDFRAKLLGPTDPKGAPADSIRGTIFARWQDLGLAKEPNISDNGVHASASPIEALFERLNWLGTTLAEDPFGSRLLENNVSAELIEEWRRDPQVSYGRGAAKTKVSLYDALEDLDVDRCITRCKDIALTGRTHATVHKNRAFVFIKPHAMTPQVKDLVRKTFEEQKIRITQEGLIEAADIDQDMLIDKHYYAIASKATLLTPEKLPVPQDKFKAKFGIEWADALSGDLALNAKDACDKLGLNAPELMAEWNKAKAAGGLVKFSGGFYCAKLDLGEKGAYYVFNGFFMEMRNKFVRSGAEIYYFVVEWDPVHLSWAEFRGSVLGPTDPTLAPAGSIRGVIFQSWQALGLAGEPNMSDNGVHASASPVEALFERMNWLGVRLERDPFGKLLLQAQVTPAQVDEWSRDPQVTYGFGPKKGSFYDCLEDKDTDACLEECLVVARAGHTAAVVRNSAFLFVKPHAVTEATKELVRRHLESQGVEVVKEGLIEAAAIDGDMLIDKHCHALASKATMPPEKLSVPGDLFREQFGVEWADALKAGSVLNARQACETLKLDGAGLGKKWMEAKESGNFLKFGDGFYCARIDMATETDGRGTYYVINGFFMEMRAKYVAPGAAVHYFCVDWDPLDLSWSDFRGRVLGPTDPAAAPEGSLRALIHQQWRDLGLQREPDIGDNGVHGSASPFQALSERMNWLGVPAEDDSFGQLLLHAGVTKDHIETWSLDPQVTFVAQLKSRTCSLYDALEDLDADRCVTQCQLIVGDGPTAGRQLSGDDAEKLAKTGNVLRTACEEGYDAYSFKYFVEDADGSGQIWEVVSTLEKTNGRYEETATWSARVLTIAEAQQVLAGSPQSPSSPGDKRSPLHNRLPAGTTA